MKYLLEGTEEENGNPSQLFDIRLLINQPIVPSITDLVAQVTFESFGNVPTPVEMYFMILDSSGNVSWEGVETVTVETTLVFTKNFGDLHQRPDGNYTLRLRTLYNNGVEDTFEESFEIRTDKGKAWWILWVIGAFLLILFVLWLLLWKRCVCDCKEEDKECLANCEEKVSVAKKIYCHRHVIFSRTAGSKPLRYAFCSYLQGWMAQSFFSG
ncbi:MAG: hypothetical protein WDN67_02800 [Candidatus Moraniibacteriota bacterium]